MSKLHIRAVGHESGLGLGRHGQFLSRGHGAGPMCTLSGPGPGLEANQLAACRIYMHVGHDINIAA